MDSREMNQQLLFDRSEESTSVVVSKDKPSKGVSNVGKPILDKENLHPNRKPCNVTSLNPWHDEQCSKAPFSKTSIIKVPDKVVKESDARPLRQVFSQHFQQSSTNVAKQPMRLYPFKKLVPPEPVIPILSEDQENAPSKPVKGVSFEKLDGSDSNREVVFHPFKQHWHNAVVNEKQLRQNTINKHEDKTGSSDSSASRPFSKSSSCDLIPYQSDEVPFPSSTTRNLHLAPPPGLSCTFDKVASFNKTLKPKVEPIAKPNKSDTQLSHDSIVSYDLFENSLFSNSNRFWIPDEEDAVGDERRCIEHDDRWINPAAPPNDTMPQTIGPHTKSQVTPQDDAVVLSEFSSSGIQDPPKRLPFPKRLELLYEDKSWGTYSFDYNITDLLPKNHGQLLRSDFANIIANHASRRGVDGAKKAECILRFMLSEYDAGRSSVRPDGGCYNKVLHAYAHIGDAKKAEEIMSLMCRVYEGGDKLAEPNNRHYTSLIFAWQKSEISDGPERCEDILDEMHQLHDLGKYSKCKPDSFSYTSVFHCWANSNRSDAAERAEGLFRKMLDRYHAGDDDLRPDTIAYSNLINAFTKENQTKRAEAILWEMVDDYMKGNETCKPTTRNFNTVLAMWSTSQDRSAPIHAEDLVRRWLNLSEQTDVDAKPDKYSYGLLLKSWSNSERSDAPDRIDAILAWMNERSKNGDHDARLDFIKCSTGVKAHLKFKKYRRAAPLVHKMIDEYSAGRNRDMPDFKILSGVISGLCAQKSPGEAEALLRKLLKFNRDVKGYRSVDYLVQEVLKTWGVLGQPELGYSMMDYIHRLHDSRVLKELPSRETYRLAISSLSSSSDPEKQSRMSDLQWKMNRVSGRQENSTQSRPFRGLRY